MAELLTQQISEEKAIVLAQKLFDRKEKIDESLLLEKNMAINKEFDAKEIYNEAFENAIKARIDLAEEAKNLAIIMEKIANDLTLNLKNVDNSNRQELLNRASEANLNAKNVRDFAEEVNKVSRKSVIGSEGGFAKRQVACVDLQSNNYRTPDDLSLLSSSSSL